MPDYIVCHKKRNNPRIDVRICESKCAYKEECKEYLAYRRLAPQPTPPSSPKDSSNVELEAA